MKTVDNVLAKARIAIAPWEIHLKDQSHFKDGGMTPAAAEAAWRVKWKQGLATVPGYTAVAQQGQKAACTLPRPDHPQGRLGGHWGSSPMGAGVGTSDAGAMTTSTLPARNAAPHVDVAPGPAQGVVARGASGVAPDRARLLALVAPLLLFTHGILTWVDGLGAVDPAQRTGSVLAVVAGGILVLAVGGFAALASALASRTQRAELAVPVTMLGAFGAGATAAVWLGRGAGWLVDPLPAALSTGGAVLGRSPSGSRSSHRPPRGVCRPARSRSAGSRVPCWPSPWVSSRSAPSCCSSRSPR